MNERERWWKACAESKQSELDNMKLEFERSVREHEECKRYADSLNMELDKANARIAQLEEALKSCADYSHKSLMVNHWAVDALTKQPDTWLLEHDNAVEVRVLEDVEVELNNPWDGDSDTYCAHEAEMGILELIREMIEDRK